MWIAREAFGEQADRGVTRAALLHDRPHLAMDLIQIVAAHLVQLVGTELGRGVLPGQQGVDLVAVSHRPDARVLARVAHQIVLEELEHALEGRVDHVLHSPA